MSLTTTKYCIECKEAFTGRSDKKFCTPYCKSAYHYKKNQEEENTYQTINKQLKTNRKLLKHYNKAGKATIRKEKLLKEGFNPNYFTHYWKARNGNLYLFCYEFGFMQVEEKHATKYVLIQWQKYMEK